MGYAVAAAVPVTALAFFARENVGVVITFDKNAIAAATDITRANPGLYTALGSMNIALTSFLDPSGCGSNTRLLG